MTSSPTQAVTAHVKVLQSPEGSPSEHPFAFSVEYTAFGFILPFLDVHPHHGPTLHDAEEAALKFSEERCKLLASTLNNILNAALQTIYTHQENLSST